MMKQRFGKKDLILMLVIVVVLILIFAGYRVRYHNLGNSVTVQVNGELYGVYDLDKNQVVEIRQDDSTCNILVIQDGEADMIDADCPDQLCVKQKNISADGETIVCLPHKVVVEVQSEERKSEIDVIAQ